MFIKLKVIMLLPAIFVSLLLITCSSDKPTQPGESNTVTDIDGNVYRTVTIGTQIWMVEDLRVTHYRNGEPIPYVRNDTTWNNLISGSCCDYCDSLLSGDKYGRLYNWYVIADSNGIAPEGWHVPTIAEWIALVDYLGGDSIAGGKMKERHTRHWINPNIGATNQSGFTALPGGLRHKQGSYWYRGYCGCYWAASEYTDLYAYFIQMSNDIPEVFIPPFESKNFGYSIRCIKD